VCSLLLISSGWFCSGHMPLLMLCNGSSNELSLKVSSQHAVAPKADSMEDTQCLYKQLSRAAVEQQAASSHGELYQRTTWLTIPTATANAVQHEKLPATCMHAPAAW
jgi:hypothetical protein